ncbi:MAG: chromosome condensation protein CrcB, partial [Mesorhizobium sp.]
MIGGVLRALASLTSTALWGNGFPFGTLLVNIVGSFLIGFYATLTGPDGRAFASPLQRHFFMTGFCGGLTT